jgi:hypothetical protein
MIGLLKSCVEQALVGRRYSYGELTIMVAEAALISNSQPDHQLRYGGSDGMRTDHSPTLAIRVGHGGNTQDPF